VDIYTGKNTHVEGAVIAAENDNLVLNTETLTYKDIQDSDTSEAFNTGVSVSAGFGDDDKGDNDEKNDGEEAKEDDSPYSGTSTTDYSSKDKEQINRATIGKGTIIIRSDPDAGLEGLNRDLAKAQEITKDNETVVKIYVDPETIKDIASGAEGLQKNSKKLAEAIGKVIDKAINAITPKPKLSVEDRAIFKSMIKGAITKNSLIPNANDEQLDSYAEGLTELMALEYERLRSEDVDHLDAMIQITQGVGEYRKWASKMEGNGIEVTVVNGKQFIQLPGNVTNIDGGTLSGPAATFLAVTAAVGTIMLIQQADPDTAAKLGKALKNGVVGTQQYIYKLGKKIDINTWLTNWVPGYAESTGQKLVKITKVNVNGIGVETDKAMEIVSEDLGSAFVKDPETNVYYDAWVDSDGTVHARTDKVYVEDENGNLALASEHSSGDGKSTNAGSGSESTPANPDPGNDDDDDLIRKEYENKPEYEVDQAHQPGKPGWRPNKTQLPSDAKEAYKNAVPKGDGKTWFGWNANRTQIYRFSGNQGKAHFNGTVDRRILNTMKDDVLKRLGINRNSALKIIKK